MSLHHQDLQRSVRDCRLVLLAATELEAAPVRTALVDVATLELATKTLYVGGLRSAESTAGSSGSTVGSPESAAYSSIHVVLAVSGCDKANPAMVLAALLQTMPSPPDMVLHVGIAGGFDGASAREAVELGDVVIATQEAYSDTGSSGANGWKSVADLGLPIAIVNGVECGGVFAVDSGKVDWAVGVLRREEALWRADGDGRVPTIHAGPCVTSSTVTGTVEEARLIAERWGAVAESMEGAAAAHVCACYGVPYLEVRGISNMVGESDRSKWCVERAVEVAGRAALTLAVAWAAEKGG